jgi:hypothetical protein
VDIRSGAVVSAEDSGKKRSLSHRVSKCETCATKGNKLCVCRRRKAKPKRKKGEDGMGRVDGGGALPGSGQYKGKGAGEAAGKTGNTGGVGGVGGVGLAMVYAAATMEVSLSPVEVQSIHISSLVFACPSSNLECVFSLLFSPFSLRFLSVLSPLSLTGGF